MKLGLELELEVGRHDVCIMCMQQIVLGFFFIFEFLKKNNQVDIAPSPPRR